MRRSLFFRRKRRILCSGIYLLTNTIISTQMAFSFFEPGTYAGPVNFADTQTSSQTLSEAVPSVSI